MEERGSGGSGKAGGLGKAAYCPAGQGSPPGGARQVSEEVVFQQRPEREGKRLEAWERVLRQARGTGRPGAAEERQRGPE